MIQILSLPYPLIFFKYNLHRFPCFECFKLGEVTHHKCSNFFEKIESKKSWRNFFYFFHVVDTLLIRIVNIELRIVDFMKRSGDKLHLHSLIFRLKNISTRKEMKRRMQEIVLEKIFGGKLFSKHHLWSLIHGKNMRTMRRFLNDEFILEYHKKEVRYIYLLYILAKDYFFQVRVYLHLFLWEHYEHCPFFWCK